MKTTRFPFIFLAGALLGALACNPESEPIEAAPGAPTARAASPSLAISPGRNTPPTSEPPDAPKGGCSMSTLPISLLATIEAASERDGMALLEGGTRSKERPRVYQTGDEVTADAVLWAVHRRKVLLRRGDGSFECVRLRSQLASSSDFEPSGPSDAPASAPPRTRPGIRQLRENEWEVSSEQVMYAMANIGQISQEAKVTEYFEDGRRAGFRLTSVQPDSVLYELGFENDDVITAINGLSVSENPVQIYQALQMQMSFKVDLLRDGKPTSAHYNIR